MHYDPRIFYEKWDRQTQSADMIKNSRLSPAYRADGTPAVLIKYGRSFGVLTPADAIRFATLIADTVDEAKGMTNKQ